MEYNVKNKSIVLEEKPIIELPTLLKVILIFLVLGLGISLLFLPPYIVLVVFLGICVTISILFNPFIGAILFIAAAYIQPMQFMSYLIKYHITTIAAFVILLIWGFHILIYRDFYIPKSKQLFYFFGFVFITTFSSFWYWDESSFLYIDLLKVFILYFLIVNLTKTKKHIFILIGTLLGLGLISSIYAIYQHIRGIGMIYTGEGIIRVTGFSDNPNDLALSMLLLIPLAFSLFIKSKNIFLRMFAVLMVILFILTIVFTYSRAIFLALSVVLILSIWKFIGKGKVLISLLCIFLIIATILLLLPQRYWQRIASITNLSAPSIEGRIDGDIVGFKMMLKHPFLGVGIGRWFYEYWPIAFESPLIKTKVSTVPHNIFIEVGSQTGIIGLVIFILFIFYVFKDIRIAYHNFVNTKDYLLTIFSQSLEIGLIGFIIAGMFLAALHLKFLWVMVGLILALRNIAINKLLLDPKITNENY